MDTKANYVSVGIFTLVLVSALFAMIYWSFGINSSGDTTLLRVRIPGSAAGLGRGSAVLFNGIKVGDVRRVYIDVNNPTVAIADTEVDRLTPITASTRADIGLAGLTGQASIELKGGNPDEPNLLVTAEAENTIPEIEANPSAVTNLLQTAQDIFKRADSVLNTLEGFTTDVRGPMTSTAQNIEVFSQALSRNAEGVDKFLANFGELSETIGNVSGRLDSTLAAAENLLNSVDRDKVGEIVTNLETFTGRLQTASADLEGIMQNVDQTMVSVRGLAENAGGVVEKASGILDDVQAGVQTAAGSIERLSTSAAGTLTRADDVLTSAKTGIDTAVASVERLSTDASNTLKGVDEVLVTARSGVDTAVTSFNRLSTDASSTLGKVNGLLDTAQSSIDTAAGSVEQVARDASNSLTRVDEILAGVDPAKVDNVLTAFEGAATNARSATQDIAALAQKFSERSGDIEQIIANTRGITDNLGNASARVGGVIDKADSLLAGIDSQAVSTAVTDFQGAAASARKAANDVAALTERFSTRGDDIEQIITAARGMADNLNQASTRVDGVLAKVDALLQSVDAAKVNNALTSFETAAGDAQRAANDVAEFTNRFTARSDDVDAIVTDAKVIAENLRQASTRVEGVLVQAEQLLGSGEAEGLMADAGATLQSFRQVADTLNSRLGTILDGLGRFSGQGLRDVESLVRDSRRSINRIEETITEFERNPQRIITGGDGAVRQYDGRVRR